MKISGLSGNEMYCMSLKGYVPCGIVVGNSVQSMGFLRGVGSAFSNILGGEITNVTEMIHDGRERAYERMIEEAKNQDANGIVGVSSDLRDILGNSEFIFTGTGVKNDSKKYKFFSSAGDAQELYCHMDAGYEPFNFVFGNIAYSVGLVGGIVGSLKLLKKGEILEFSDVFNKTRHYALDRLEGHALKSGANSVVGIRTKIMNFEGFNEMYMTGTATTNKDLNIGNKQIVSSDLTGEELWSLTKIGYSPIKMLMTTSVYSLGVVGGVKSIFKSFVKGELSELTELIYHARDEVFSKLDRQANEVNADEVVGIKTYIVELGSGLIEFVAVGTAVKKNDKVKVQTEQLIPQAIIQDKDTWISGESEFKFNRNTSST
jgi:uncharacterized protein YbjQ (UPF0145 family)